MRVRVTFRVSPETGQVELFQVDHAGQRQATDHDATHERIARAIADVIDPRADILEEAGPAAPARPYRQIPLPEPDQTAARTGPREQADG